MPYIKRAQKLKLESFKEIADNAGELNFQITTLLNNYRARKANTYQTYNDIIGALEGAKLEIYRRVVAAYEDQKKSENGDVY